MREPRHGAVPPGRLAYVDAKVSAPAPELQEFLQPVERKTLMDDERAALVTGKEAIEQALIATLCEHPHHGLHPTDHAKVATSIQAGATARRGKWNGM